MKILMISFILTIIAMAEVIPSKISFSAIGRPSFIKINGEAKQLEHKVVFNGDGLSGKFLFELASLKTGIELRDEHMKDNYLEVNKYPKESLEIKDLDVSKSESKQKALLTLHGVTKAVEVVFDFVQEQDHLVINGDFEVNLVDFKIEIPSFQGITVAKNVKVKVQTKVKKESLK